MRNRILLSAALAPIMLMAASLPATARPMTETDLATLKRLGSPTVSPDGRWLVYQVTETDLAANKRTPGLWLLDMSREGAEPVRIADSDGGEHDPAFGPDGALYFLSGKSGSEQLWRVAVSGGVAPAAQVSDLATDISGFKISPDGKRVLVWGDVGKDCATFGGCKTDGNTALPGPGTGREYDSGFVRHWDHWETPGNYNRPFVFDLASGVVTGKGQAVDGGVTGDAPGKPFGDGSELAWSRDSRTVYFTLRKADKDEPRSTNLDIYAAPVATGRAVNLTEANQATDTLPTVSPDGKWLAYVAMKRPTYEADRQVLMLRDLRTGKTRALTESWDRSVGSIAWAADGRSIYVTAGDTLDTPLFRVDVKTGLPTRLTKDGHVGGVVPLAGGAVLVSLDTLNAPSDLYLIPAAGTGAGELRQVTAVNADLLREIDPVTVERFRFAGAGGDPVWGMIVKPTGAAAKQTVRGKLPVAFVVHGGPQGSFGDSWSFRWNPKVMASQGYGVVTIDFHGSTGYGQAFTDSINQDWGGKPLEDLKLGLAAAGARDSGIDTGNACALGASYGGYMMNWIAGQWPDQFKCLVQHDGVFDLRAMAFETEELWFDEWDHGGPWWARKDAERWNPVNHVTKWKTPMLVITGEKDFRIPYTQGLAAFAALQRQDIPSKLLVFPDENHWVLKAQNSVQWHRNVFDWMARWTRRDGKLAK